jgi:4-diphosphocytidyl-2-C-methyl-D-erythritol kinase
MKILSPAKINLVLRILGQRSDGYHLLQTYFQLLNWGDEMKFTLRSKPSIEIMGNFGDLKKTDNLIFKAAKLLEPHKQIDKGIDISIQKNIPQGSGLGGGSSNAGTTLRLLNDLWQCNQSQVQLQKYALSLGADVPLFVLNQSAWATGIGENLEPNSIKDYYFVLIFPPVQISTVDIFMHPDLCRNQQPINTTNINDEQLWSNTCTPIVLSAYPEVKDMYSYAAQYANIHMSGTGSTLFCAFSNKDKAIDFCAKMPRNWHTEICQSKKIEKNTIRL